MLIVGKELTKAIKDDNRSAEEIADYLMKNYPSWEIALSLAELMQEVENTSIKKVVVTQEDMDTILSIFRVRGTTEDGQKEYRGRKRKEA